MNLNGTDINTFSRDILNEKAELNYDDSKKKVSEMIGNVEEMCNPVDKTTNSGFYGMIKTNGTTATDTNGVDTDNLFCRLIKRTDDNVKTVQIINSNGHNYDNQILVTERWALQLKASVI